MSPAADDERTSRHERAKDRAFYGTILLAVALIAIGVVLIGLRGAWAFLGGFLFLMGGSFGAASVIGLTYRRKARKVLQDHDWVQSVAEVRARPRSGRSGRTIIELVETGRTIAVTGLTSEVVNRIEREKQIEYAGDLNGTSMIFVRVVDADEVYIAVLPRKTEPAS